MVFDQSAHVDWWLMRPRQLFRIKMSTAVRKRNRTPLLARRTVNDKYPWIDGRLDAVCRLMSGVWSVITAKDRYQGASGKVNVWWMGKGYDRSRTILAWGEREEVCRTRFVRADRVSRLVVTRKVFWALSEWLLKSQVAFYFTGAALFLGSLALMWCMRVTPLSPGALMSIWFAIDLRLVVPHRRPGGMLAPEKTKAGCLPCKKVARGRDQWRIMAANHALAPYLERDTRWSTLEHCSLVTTGAFGVNIKGWAATCVSA